METARPAPGTLNDLLADAADLGMRDASERRLREWTRLGLLGSPTRQSLGRGHGQAPALYSSRQRALFHAVVHHRVLGHKNATLAQIPVWAWLFNSDPGVTLDQLKKALGTALGSETMSKRAADQAAK